MPGVRSGIVWDLPRSRLALAQQWGLARRLRAGNYSTALVMPRTWKSAIAPALAGIPERVGFVGEARFGLLNQWRWGEKALPRLIDKNAALALPDGASLPEEWPVPQLHVPAGEASRWRQANGLGSNPAVALAPGSVGASKRWTYYPETARLLAQQGLDVWVVGGPGEKTLAAEIVAAGGPRVRDLTGNDLRNGILAMAAAGVAISNDSGLMHVAAAIGTPTMGIFGPTSPQLWAPLNESRGDSADQDDAILPALSPHGLPDERPSLHAGHSRLRRGRYRRARAERGRGPRLTLRSQACAALARSLPKTPLPS